MRKLVAASAVVVFVACGDDVRPGGSGGAGGASGGAAGGTSGGAAGGTSGGAAGGTSGGAAGGTGGGAAGGTSGGAAGGTGGGFTDAGQDAGLPDISIATLGVDGGVLRVGGVVVTFPPGSLRTTETLTLSVLDGGDGISIEPDVILLESATVSLPLSLWPAFTPGFAIQDWGNGYESVGDFTFDSLGRASFLVPGFSRTHFERIVAGTRGACGTLSPGQRWPPPPSTDGVSWLVAFDAGCLVSLDSLDAGGPPADPISYCKPSCLTNDAGTTTSRTDCGCGPSTVGPACTLLCDRRPDEARMMASEARDAVLRVRALVKQAYGTDYDLVVNGAYDSSRVAHNFRESSFSNHGVGVAVDLAVCRWVGGVCEKDSSLYNALPPMLFNEGFSFVQFETLSSRGSSGWHIHGSISSPTCGIDAGPTRVGRGACFPSTCPADAGPGFSSTCGGPPYCCVNEFTSQDLGCCKHVSAPQHCPPGYTYNTLFCPGSGGRCVTTTTPRTCFR